MMANLIAYDLDLEHLELADKYKLIRTRWIDDIVFSGRRDSIQEAIPLIIGSVKSHGFIINNKKSRFVSRRKKPEIVGLEVNRKSPHIPLAKIQSTELLIEKCINEGALIVQYNYNPKGEGKIKNLKLSLNGQIRSIGRFDPCIAGKLREKMNNIDWDCCCQYSPSNP